MVAVRLPATAGIAVQAGSTVSYFGNSMFRIGSILLVKL
jgi:hypothetical protein